MSKRKPAKRRPGKSSSPAKDVDSHTADDASGQRVAETGPATEPLAKLETIDQSIQEKLDAWRNKRRAEVYPFLMGSHLSITDDTVGEVLNDLRQKHAGPVDRLDVIVHSGGGDIHAAYSLGLLFRRYATKDLTFVVPRSAKSAATLLVCSGNRILMGAVSELGPVDPQITQFNPLEKRLEQFSPLDIEATLELIRNEFRQGHPDLANGLLQRLQFPLTLGSFQKSLEIGKAYLRKLLRSRMFGQDSEDEAARAAKELVEGYSDHGYCIDIDEAQRIGLVVDEIDSGLFGLAWDVYQMNKRKDEIVLQQKRRQFEELLRSLPSGFEEELPEVLRNSRSREHDES